MSVSLQTLTLPLHQTLIDRLKQTEQNPRYHAEGDVYIHTGMVLEAFQSEQYKFELSEEDKEVLHWACILHDVGKPEVSVFEGGRWTAKGHEKAGISIARKILLDIPEISSVQRQRILELVGWHHIPLRWGLQGREISDYQLLATRIDLRLLGIFAHFDMMGRDCVNKTDVLGLIAHFNEHIVPRIEQEWGAFTEIQSRFQNKDHFQKDALWSAFEHREPELIGHLLSIQREELKPAMQQCTFVIGNDAEHKQAWIQKNQPSTFVVKGNAGSFIEKKTFEEYLSNCEDVILSLPETSSEARKAWAAIARKHHASIRYIILEQDLAEAAYPPHPWEAHKIKNEELRIKN